ncbi:hypothetical protein COLO4_35222 [Corchorus olitorius]|uniref:DUF7769 domain-containing protein n=1 Tax=Corchorus olitorius TaxID=93759 RepID=A0A1R3GHT9_9ROSI|nr:hypothetical protein COLO4_35222 [Corchorus olitorius]
MDSSIQTKSIPHKTFRNLTNEERQTIYEALLRESKDGLLPKGILISLASRIEISPDSITNVPLRRRTNIRSLAKALQEPARRSSKNRAAGTLETKPILSMTKDVIRACLIERVLPAIQSKWPQCDAMKSIYIQQDNVRPHIDPNDVEFLEAVGQTSLDIRWGNNYKLPHMGKDRLQKEGNLTSTLQCDFELVTEVLNHLQQ